MSEDVFLSVVEGSRIAAQKNIAEYKRKLEEQYFTPSRVSKIMAAMFTYGQKEHIRLLDPCCGVGNLTAACYSKSIEEEEKVSLFLVEKDKTLCAVAKNNFGSVEQATIINSNFFHVVDGFDNFDRVVLNPPYSKLLSTSEEVAYSKHNLGYADNNLYSLFVSTCLAKLSINGELVAIIPRSFCNGPMFKGFRQFIFDNYFIHEIYLFESRKIFFDSNVLQEILIVKISRVRCDTVRISHEANDGAVVVQDLSSDLLVFGADPQKFIHIPLAVGDNLLLERVSRFTDNLKSLGLRASTGKVVDFRCEQWLEFESGDHKVNLLYQDNLLGSNKLDLELKGGRKNAL